MPLCGATTYDMKMIGRRPRSRRRPRLFFEDEHEDDDEDDFSLE
jgi:hypothetical protein